MPWKQIISSENAMEVLITCECSGKQCGKRDKEKGMSKDEELSGKRLWAMATKRRRKEEESRRKQRKGR